jgi:hypothetical protein
LGLATRGITVLRFDKLPNAHPAEVAGNPDFTATDEYVPDALTECGLQRAGLQRDPAAGQGGGLLDHAVPVAGFGGQGGQDPEGRLTHAVNIEII